VNKESQGNESSEGGGKMGKALRTVSEFSLYPAEKLKWKMQEQTSLVKCSAKGFKCEFQLIAFSYLSL